MVRGFLRYVFSTMVLAGITAHEAQAQKPGAAAVSHVGVTTAQQDIKFNVSDTLALTADQQSAVNQILNARAQKKFFANAERGASASYHQEIATTEKEINASLAYFPDARCNRVIVLNHERFLTGVALGMEQKTVLGLLLKERGVDPRLINTDALLRNMTGDFSGADGSKTMTTEPALVVTPNRLGILVLPSDYAPVVAIDGLTAQQTRAFIKHHEIAHAFDTRYFLTGYDGETIRNLNWNKPASIYKPHDGYAVASVLCLKESWADVVAVVMMLRDDAKITDAGKFIDKIITSRLNESPEHLSVGVLEGLKDEIADIGLKKLRKMDMFDVLSFSSAVNEDYGMTVGAVNAALACLYGDEETIARLKAVEKDNWEVHKGIVFARRLDESSSVTPPAPAPRHDVLRATEGWSAKDSLLARAVKDGGGVSGETMVDAYGALMDDLRLEAKKQPDIAYAKMAKLTALYSGLSDMNFAQLNEERKISLTTVLPEAKGATSSIAVYQAVIR